MISNPIKIRVNGRLWYYQKFGPDSLNLDEETAYRLYDDNGDFVAEFRDYESMKSWILDRSVK